MDEECVFFFFKGKMAIVEGSRVGVRGEKNPAGGHRESSIVLLSSWKNWELSI